MTLEINLFPKSPQSGPTGFLVASQDTVPFQIMLTQISDVSVAFFGEPYLIELAEGPFCCLVNVDPCVPLYCLG